MKRGSFGTAACKMGGSLPQKSRIYLALLTFSLPQWKFEIPGQLKLLFATEAGGAMAEVGLLPFARIALQVSLAVLPRYRIESDQRLNSEDVVLAPNRIKIYRGVPKFPYCDNGSEFSRKAMDLGAHQNGVRVAFPRARKANW
jgi:hypothetical protein